MAVEQSDRHPIAFRAAGRVEPLFPSQPSIQTFSRDWEPDLFQWEKQRLFETREGSRGNSEGIVHQRPVKGLARLQSCPARLGYLQLWDSRFQLPVSHPMTDIGSRCDRVVMGDHQDR